MEIGGLHGRDLRRTWGRSEARVQQIEISAVQNRQQLRLDKVAAVVLLLDLVLGVQKVPVVVPVPRGAFEAQHDARAGRRIGEVAPAVVEGPVVDVQHRKCGMRPRNGQARCGQRRTHVVERVELRARRQGDMRTRWPRPVVAHVVDRNVGQRIVRRERKLVGHRRGLLEVIVGVAVIGSLRVRGHVVGDHDLDRPEDVLVLGFVDQRNVRRRIEPALAECLAVGTGQHAEVGVGHGRNAVRVTWVQAPDARDRDVARKRIARRGVVAEEEVVGRESVGCERAVAAPQRIVPGGGAGKHDVEAILLQVPISEDQTDTLAPAAAGLGLAIVGRDLGALEVLAQDEVHHAPDRVAAVNGRGALLQDFNPLDRRQRQAVHVDRRAVGHDAVRGNAPAVDQHQGASRSQAMQRNSGQTAGGRARVLRSGGGARTGRERQRSEQFFDRGGTGLLDLLLADHADRQRGFALDPLDQRACDLDAFNRRFLGPCTYRKREGRDPSHGNSQRS